MSHPEDRDLRAADPGRVGLLQGSLTRYRLRPSVEAFVDRHGVLCFVRPGGQDLVVRDAARADVALVERLRSGWEPADALARAVGIDRSAVLARLESLVRADLVIARDDVADRPLPGEEEERFSRQLPYLAELGDERALQRRLRESKVVVLGCGGLGTWAIATLACIGVGSLVLVDDDTVSLSNLNRQILYVRGDVGEPKVAVSRRWLAAFDPGIDVRSIERRIESVADVVESIEGADAVVLAADWPPYAIARWVNAACVEARTPFIVAGQLPPIIKVGPTYVPGKGACLACHELALARESYAFEDYVAHRAADSSVASTVGPASCVAGGLIGLEMLHVLTGHIPVTHAFALIVHMQTLDVRRAPIARDASCATCKHVW